MKAKKILSNYEKVRANIFIIMVIIWFFLGLGVVVLSLKELLITSALPLKNFYFFAIVICSVVVFCSLHLLGLFRNLNKTQKVYTYPSSKQMKVG